MRDDLEFNVKFCEAVERFPCLYDTTRSDYCNRFAQEKAWTKIGEILKVNASDCKDRWKNIRGRYVKCKNQKNLPTGKIIKDYYLAPHLHFLNSFLKPRKRKRNRINKMPSNNGGDIDSSMDQEEEDSEKAEDSQVGDNESEVNRSPTSSLPELKYMIPAASVADDDGYRKRNLAKTLPDVDDEPYKYLEMKQYMPQQENMPQKSEPVDSDLAFLQSMLPDMKCMDGSKKRKFKMGILKLAEQLLEPQTSKSCFSFETERGDKSVFE